MTCDRIAPELYEFTRGRLDDADLRRVRDHLATCPSCSAEAASLPKSLSLLSAIEEIEPSPRILENLSREISASGRPNLPRFRLLRVAIGIAAAASLLVAVFSFLLLYSANPTLAATVSFTAGDGVRVGQSVLLAAPFHASEYTALTIPDVGTLKLNRDTRIEFLSPRRVVLQGGEVFAEIQPGGRGFVVEVSGASATVHGTRFGVRMSDRPLLYVIEGRVELSGAAGRIEVGAEQTAVAAPKPEIVERENASRHAGWIAAYERPNLWIEAKAGSPSWTVTLQTHSPVPVYLRSFRDEAAHLYARIEPPSGRAVNVPVGGDSIRVLRGSQGPDGLLRLDVSSSCEVAVTLDPGLFREGPGTYRVSIGCFSPPDPDHRSLWSGVSESLPVPVEVGR